MRLAFFGVSNIYLRLLGRTIINIRTAHKSMRFVLFRVVQNVSNRIVRSVPAGRPVRRRCRALYCRELSPLSVEVRVRVRFTTAHPHTQLPIVAAAVFNLIPRNFSTQKKPAIFRGMSGML